MMQRIVLLFLLALSACDSTVPDVNHRDLSDYSDSSSSSYSDSSSSSGGWSLWGYLLQLLHHCPPGQHYKDGVCKKPSHHHHSSSSHSSGGGGGGHSNYTDDTTYNAVSWGTDGWSDDAWGTDGYTTAYASRQAQSGSGMSAWPFAVGALVACMIGAAFVIIRVSLTDFGICLECILGSLTYLTLNFESPSPSQRKNRSDLGGSNNTFSSFFSRKKQGALNEDFDKDEPNFIEISQTKNKYASPKNMV